MTVIVVRDGVMAVDSRASRSYLKVGEAKKWREVPELHGGGYVAGTGKISDLIAAMEDYCRTGKVDHSSDNCELVHLKADGSVFHFDDAKVWIEIEANFHANGCGMVAALGALHVGATAEEAAQAACALVDGCGGKVHVLSVAS